MMPGLWHEVTIKKYLKKKYVKEWFMQGRNNWTCTSNFWRALTTSLSIITDWLVWKSGNGRDIRIGTDPMVGSYTYYKLSRNLILKLKAQGIKFLAQARTSEVEDTTYTSWKKADSLGMEGEQKEEWNNIVKGLVGSVFVLNNEKYTLLWSWDTKRGQVNDNHAYKVQMLELRKVEPCYWYNELWNWQSPLKVKRFVWLMMEQRILTWENLNKRGLNGPSRNVSCLRSVRKQCFIFLWSAGSSKVFGKQLKMN